MIKNYNEKQNQIIKDLVENFDLLELEKMIRILSVKISTERTKLTNHVNLSKRMIDIALDEINNF